MAYENEDEQLQKQLEAQLGAAPEGAALPDLAALGDASTGTGAFGGGAKLPTPTGNTGVTGGAMGGPVEKTQEPGAAALGGSRADAVKAAKAAGYTDIEGAGGLKTGDYMGALEGFNTGAWGSGERGSNTLKNSFGKIASRYDPTQPGAAKNLMNDPDFRDMFPDAILIDHPNQDQIDFDGPGGDPPVDVIRAATAGGGGQGWQWGTQDGSGATGGGGGLDPAAIMGGGTDINAMIEALMSGQDSETQKIIQELLNSQGQEAMP